MEGPQEDPDYEDYQRDRAEATADALAEAWELAHAGEPDGW